MLNVGTPSPFDSTSLLPPNKPNFSLSTPFISKTARFLYSSQQTQHTHLSFKTRYNGLSLLCVSAVKNKRRKGVSEVMETGDSDFVDVEDFDDDCYGDDANGDDEDEGVIIPIGKMKRWLEKKPRGFGDGKVYDTSIEDKLLHELEQSRQAQITNFNKLKDEPVKPSSKLDEEKKKALEAVPSGICVRLFNLPKKKNIHRDLKSAFEGVPGIINIIPAVSGNKKTKDPVCKGFAFVDFKSEEYATRFVQLFSGQSIAFGKVQKQIKCDMMNSSSSNSVDERSADDTDSDSKLTVTGFEEDPDAVFDEDENSFDSVMEVASNGSAPDDELEFAEIEDVRESLQFVTVSQLNDNNDTKGKKSATDSSSSNQRKKIQAIEEKLIAKGKVKKVTKLDIPGADPDTDFHEDENSFDSVMEVASNGSAPDDELEFAEIEDARESLQFVTVSKLNDNNDTKRKKSATDSSFSNQRKKIQAMEKKPTAKGKVKKVTKLYIPGSAKRLKIREKAMLADVFSKYAESCFNIKGRELTAYKI